MTTSQMMTLAPLDREEVTVLIKRAKVRQPMYLHELLTKAEQGMGFVCGDLRDAMGKADPVLSIVVLDLCEQANRLQAELSRVREAVGTRETVSA